MTADTIQAAKDRLSLDLTAIDDHVNALRVRVCEEDTDNWSVRYLGDMAKDMRTALAELSRLEGENDRLIREAEGTERAHAEYRRRWRNDDLFKTIDQIRTHWAGLRPAWAEDLALLQSRILHQDTALAERDEALKPFGTEFAATFVDENGWTGPMNKERIVDWFGPSDFRRAAALLASPPSGVEIKPVTMLVDQDWLSRHVVTDPNASVEAGPDVLAWLSENRNVELSFDYGDADEDGKGWCVHRVNGGVNDREWTLIGTGATPLDALRAALQRKGEAR